jgi:hypothetical protein
MSKTETKKLIRAEEPTARLIAPGVYWCETSKGGVHFYTNGLDDLETRPAKSLLKWLK